MTTKVRIPTSLRPLVGGKDIVEAKGGNVAELISDLSVQFGGLASRLYDSSGKVHRFVNLYVNEEDIRSLAGLDTQVGERDVVSIIPAIAGG